MWFLAGYSHQLPRNMYRILATACLLAAVLALQPKESVAQVKTQVGPRVGFDLNDVEAFLVGGELRLEVETLPIDFNAVFDYYFKSNYDFWQLSFNALYPIAPTETVRPYVGAGLGFAGADASSLLGVNILGGAIFTIGKLRPYAQLQLTAGNPDLLAISGGLLFNIGN